MFIREEHLADQHSTIPGRWTTPLFVRDSGRDSSHVLFFEHDTQRRDGGQLDAGGQVGRHSGDLTESG
jgi:hypothetical protein